MRYGEFDTASLMYITNRPDLVFERGEGSWLIDHQGKRYLDLIQGWAVNCLGHCPPEITAALTAQAGKLLNPSPAFYNGPMIELASLLTAHSCFDRVFFANTGAEANEGAIKLARKWGQLNRGGAFEIITFGHSFHGRTLATMSASGKAGWDTIFAPQVSGFPKAVYNDIASVEALFKYDVEASRVAAIILEPVQGEGGFYAASPAFAQRLRALCDQHGILLIADEVQTGAGRTGTFFAMEQMGVAADLTTFAKSIAGGFPLAGVCGKAEYMDAIAPGGLGGTYAGSPIACAAALAVLEVFEEEHLLDRCKEVGERLVTGLKAIQAKYPVIGDVRALGAMIAVELFEGGDHNKPAAELVGKIVARARDKGLILLSCGTYYNVIRFLMPVTIPDAQLEKGIAIVAECFDELA